MARILVIYNNNNINFNKRNHNSNNINIRESDYDINNNNNNSANNNNTIKGNDNNNNNTNTSYDNISPCTCRDRRFCKFIDNRFQNRNIVCKAVVKSNKRVFYYIGATIN